MVEMVYRQTIDAEEIKALPGFIFEGEVIVIKDAEAVEDAVCFLREHAYLGFDTETRPAFHKGESYPVSLLQIATEERVYLFRLNSCGFTLSLRRLLADTRIVKIGVGIRDDLRLLRLRRNFISASFIDLQEYATDFGIGEKSFSKLMAIIFGVRISKRQRVTNWEASQLTEAQIRYAATDAWGALKMYMKLSGEQ